MPTYGTQDVLDGTYGVDKGVKRPLDGFSGSVWRSWFMGLAVVSLVVGAIALSAASGTAPALREKSVVMAELPKTSTRGWSSEGRADGDSPLRLTLLLKKVETDRLFELAMAVSDPKSPHYGKHQSREEVSAWRRPTVQSQTVVRDWLKSRGVDLDAADVKLETTPAQDMWSFTVPVRTAEDLLENEYSWYSHPEQGKVLRATQFSLPASVAPHINWVSPTVQFPMVNSILASPTVDAKSQHNDAGVLPEDIRNLYNIPEGEVGGTQEGNRQAIVGFLEEFVKISDLTEYFAAFQDDVKISDLNLVNDGSEGSGMETALDLELMMSVARHVPTDFWYIRGRAPDNPENEPFLKFLSQIKSHSGTRPLVFSISYCDWEESVTTAYANSVNQELAELALQGVSVLAASGDAGVEGAQPLPHPAWPGHTCDSSDKFIATFPAGSPWVTAVGATQGHTDEKGAGLSGGGFSEYFDRPSYQNAAVHDYINGPAKDELPPKWRWTEGGRAYPDVALLGRNIRIVNNGNRLLSGGTSASTPMMSAIVSLLNEHRLKAGHSPMGFLNPFLYQTAADSSFDAFNDIRDGHNPGCESDGFFAAEGWDAVTGLGSPNFPELLKASKRVNSGRRAGASASSWRAEASAAAAKATLGAKAKTAHASHSEHASHVKQHHRSKHKRRE